MKAVLVIDGYKPLEFDLSKLVTIDAEKLVVEIEKMKDGRWRLILTKPLLTPMVL